MRLATEPLHRPLAALAPVSSQRHPGGMIGWRPQRDSNPCGSEETDNKIKSLSDTRGPKILPTHVPRGVNTPRRLWDSGLPFQRALDANQGRRAITARQLGVTREGLYK